MRLSALAIVACLMACSNQSDSGTPVLVPGTPTPSPSPTPTPGVSTIPASGGTLALGQDIEITVSSGSFSQSTRIEILKIDTPTADTEDTQPVLGILSVPSRSIESYRISIGSQQPSLPIRISIRPDPNYVASRPSGAAFGVLALTTNTSELEDAYETWELVSSSIAADKTRIVFDAAPVFFSAQTPTNEFTGVFTIIADR